MKRAIGIGFIVGIVLALTGLGCAGFQRWIDSWDPPACQPGDKNYDKNTGTCACKNPGIDCTLPTDPCDPMFGSPCLNPGGFGAAKDAGSDGDAADGDAP